MLLLIMSVMNLIIDSVPKISVTILDITDKIAETSIDLRKNLKTKLPDALIAATALVYDLILITRNKSGFENIIGLKIINPYSL